MSSTYENGFNFNLVKFSSTSTITSPTSSPSSSSSSSTPSNSSTIFTKKPRTLRKRPNQTFNEAAALLSTAYPNLFSFQNLKKPEKFTKPIVTEYNDSSEPLLHFRQCNDNDDAFSFLRDSKKGFRTPSSKVFTVREKKPCDLSTVVSDGNCDEFESGDFDCESMLDEEIEETIDSIMGSRVEDGNCGATCHGGERFSHGYVRALRRVHDTNWWDFFVVDMLQISPQMKNVTPATTTTITKTVSKKKKRKVVEKLPEVALSEGFLLKLNYDDVRNAWSDRGSPFADGSPENDVTLHFSSAAGNLKSKRKQGEVREASVQRYKKKANRRLCSKRHISQ